MAPLAAPARLSARRPGRAGGLPTDRVAALAGPREGADGREEGREDGREAGRVADLAGRAAACVGLRTGADGRDDSARSFVTSSSESSRNIPRASGPSRMGP